MNLETNIANMQRFITILCSYIYGVNCVEKEELEEQHPSIRVSIPIRLDTFDDADLKLMRASLLNTDVAVIYHIARIEKELAKRGVQCSILSSPHISNQ